MLMYTRRNFLKLSAGVSSLALTGAAMPAFAQSKQVVVGTWGGDSERVLRSALAVKAKEKYGVDIVFDVGTPTARKTKLIAQASRPQNSMDLPWLVDGDMYQMNQQGILKPNDPSAIPLYDTLYPEFRTDYSVPNCYGALVLVYNKKVTPPRSIKDLWKKEYAGKIGFTDLSYDKIIPMTAIAFGGSVSNFTPAYDALLELKKQGVRVYASNEAVGAALKSEEILISLMWKGRAFQWAEQGVPILATTPSEGVYPTFFVFGTTKNTRDADSSNKVLGAALEPDVQLAVASAIGQVPTVSTAKLPADMQEKIGFTDAERARFHKPDYAYATQKATEISEFWNQKFKG
jgi:putative spermidine/putrescine transport system substrate-binding protein